jgi:MFS family permease
VAIYTNLGVTPLAWVIGLNMLLFIAVMARMISASALTSAIPDLHDRGAFMAVNSSVQQLAGGVASAFAGLIVVQAPDGQLQRYDVLGMVVIGAMVVTVLLMYPIHRAVLAKIEGSALEVPPQAA